MNPLLVLIAIAAALVAPAHAGDFDDGVRLYAARDYLSAAAAFQRSATQGHAKAQYNLGFMYENGQGVPQDFGEAQRWYEQAAKQGDVRAQFNVGALAMQRWVGGGDEKRALSCACNGQPRGPRRTRT